MACATRLLAGIALAALLAACGGGGSAPAQPAPPPVPAGPSAAEALAARLDGLPLDAFYAESFGALLERTPETLVWQSLTDIFPADGAALDDLSEAYRRDTLAMAAVVLDLLDAYDRGALSPGPRIDFDVYRGYVEDIVDGGEFFYHGFPATYSIFGVPEDTRQLFTEVHPLAAAADAEDYVSRLQQVERKFIQLAEHLERQRQNGIVEPALTLQIALDQASSMAAVNAASSPYYTAFADRVDDIPGLDAVRRDDLLNRALAAVDGPVRRGYQRLRDTLQTLRGVAPVSIGVGQYPRGREYYAYTLRHHTTTDRSAAEIHQLGLDELVRIHAEMRLVFDQLGYPQNETLAQLYGRVANDGGIVPAADVLATYENIIDVARARLDDAFDVFPSADVVVIPDAFGGYYIGPSFDGTRPGAFYAGTTRDEAWFGMPSLAYHEALPGHHTQIAIAMDQDVPAFRKVARFTGFVEGWALYAERLAYELGWYDGDPYGNLGRLQYEALRAARLVIDTGIHSLGWSFEQAVRFNQDNVGWSRSASEGAAARYSVNPGQATAYLVGMLEILEQRERAQNALGNRFDLVAFHRALLTSGAVPLSLLDDVVDRYIELAN